ncbi:MAG: hypothetical protein WCX61_01865 [Candidatus Peribacteraceae bacterium]|jgi:hypothetical protein
MEDIKRIENAGVLYALIFRRDLSVKNGVRFPAGGDAGLQIGFFERETGYQSEPHRHQPRNISLEHIAEFLSIEKGKVTVTIYDEEWTSIAEETVQSGQCIVFLQGGHAITMLEPTRIMEVKQGPYMENDKIFQNT